MYQWGLTDTLSAICTILYANLRFLTISCGIVRCWASTLRGRNNAGSTQLWLSPRIQSCDQYSRILLVSGIISKKSQQRTASFLVWCRFAVARGRFWREAAVQDWQFDATSTSLVSPRGSNRKDYAWRKVPGFAAGPKSGSKLRNSSLK